MTLDALFAIVERRLARAIGRTQKEITQIYAQAREDIQKELSKTYERYAVSGKLTAAEMAKYNRLSLLEDKLIKRMSAADRAALQLERRMTRGQYEAAYLNRAWAFDMNLQTRMSWGVIPDDAIRAAVENPLEKIASRRLRLNGRERIRTEIASGLTRGASYPDMAKSIGGAINGNRKDAMRIVRTEAGRAQVIGTQECYAKAKNIGIDGTEYWQATPDNRTRDRHGELDGVAKDEERGGWRVPGTNTYTPGAMQSGIASFDINCRCQIQFRINDEAPSVRRIRDKGVVPYETYEDWKKNRT